MTPAQIRSVRDTLQDTQAEFARRLGVHVTRVSKLENGTVTPTGPLGRLLQLLAAAAEQCPGLLRKIPD